MPRKCVTKFVNLNYCINFAIAIDFRMATEIQAAGSDRLPFLIEEQQNEIMD